jgi:hypothetical protein
MDFAFNELTSMGLRLRGDDGRVQTFPGACATPHFTVMQGFASIFLKLAFHHPRPGSNASGQFSGVAASHRSSPIAFGKKVLTA